MLVKSKSTGETYRVSETRYPELVRLHHVPRSVIADQEESFRVNRQALADAYTETEEKE